MHREFHNNGAPSLAQDILCPTGKNTCFQQVWCKSGFALKFFSDHLAQMGVYTENFGARLVQINDLRVKKMVKAKKVVKLEKLVKKSTK